MLWLKDTLERSRALLKLWLMSESLQLSGRMASWQVRSRKTVANLQEVEFRVSSQWGQDGIIDWLIERSEVPAASQTFVEFGVEDYRQSNTRFLLQNRNWRGLIMDGDPAIVKAIKSDGLAWRYDLTARSAFITRENINELISGAGFRGEIGLLSIDIDGNDYWVWEALHAIRPIICICEYNAVFGDVHPISIPYDQHFSRTKAHPSNLYFGASIAALCSLAVKKGYRFVGTNSAGNDAFFVREDYANRFVEGSLKEIRPLPSRLRESRDGRGLNSYIGGLERLRQISALQVLNVKTGAMMALRELETVYSDEWLAAISGGGVPGNSVSGAIRETGERSALNGQRMKHTPEQMMSLIPQVEVGVSSGKPTIQASKGASITEQTYSRATPHTSPE
jgi:hypothetical protein